MIRTNHHSFVSVATCSLCFAICFAIEFAFDVRQTTAAETMPPHVAARLGLEQAWARQMRVPAGAQSIVDQQVYVNEDDPHEYIEVVGTEKDGKTERLFVRISTETIGTNGQEIGKKEAERQARNQIRRLEYLGNKASIRSKLVPKVRLYTLGNDGTVDCRDAETGSPIWMARVGNRRLTYSKMGINGKYISVINGGNLIKLDATNGEEIDSVRTTNMPLYGAIHSGRYSIIPTIRNGIEGYPLYDTQQVPFQEIVQGIALAPPMKSPTSTRVAWSTSKGFFYVMESSGTPSLLFRLATDGIVSGRPVAARDDVFYFGSESGQIYGVRGTRAGRVLWSRPYGEPFYNAPMLIGKQLLIRSTYGNLYSINTDDGVSTWTYTVPNVDELISTFGGKVYVRLLTGGFSAIDLETGKTILTEHGIQPRWLLPNAQTDRLYLVGATGAVQCLRPENATMPTFNEVIRGVPTDKLVTEAVVEEQEPAGPTAFGAGQPAAKDPFGGDSAPAADPFGGGADPFGGGGADPFGGGADPFGGGGDAMADPAGGADPFADPFGN